MYIKILNPIIQNGVTYYTNKSTMIAKYLTYFFVIFHLDVVKTKIPTLIKINKIHDSVEFLYANRISTRTLPQKRSLLNIWCIAE